MAQIIPNIFDWNQSTDILMVKFCGSRKFTYKYQLFDIKRI